LDQDIRILAFLLVSTLFAVLHVYYRPFDNRYDELLDRLESRHLLVWVVSCLLLQVLHYTEQSGRPEPIPPHPRGLRRGADIPRGPGHHSGVFTRRQHALPFS